MKETIFYGSKGIHFSLFLFIRIHKFSRNDNKNTCLIVLVYVTGYLLFIYLKTSTKAERNNY